MKPFILLAFTLGCAAMAQAAEDIVIADFEGADYGAWKTTGDAFGTGPAHGTLAGQMKVDGFAGHGLVNSFHGGDKTTGTLTSPPFKIERRYISFLIGGGGFAGETCINLLSDGKVIRTATGPNTEPGGSEHLKPAGWDVGEFIGRAATIEIVDRRTGGWGHINVDQIIQTERKPPVEQRDVTREIVIRKRYLHFPVKNGGNHKKVDVLRAGNVERSFDIELADAAPDWWAFLDVSAWRGERLTVKVNTLSDDSRAFELISQEDEIKGAENLYREPMRPQLHFSARRGWNNDPNGLVFDGRQYHLFFQHNPYGWGWGNMHWGHAVSRDLVHWKELGEALYPDALGPMFSGSAVMDFNNTSGLGKRGGSPLVMIYTAAGNPTVQCLAYRAGSGDFVKYAGNPVVKQITSGNRDPKVFWYEPKRQWVMTLYVGLDETLDGKKKTRHTIHFLTSPNLKDWKVTSQIDGFFECPDFFPLAIDGNAQNTKWVLTAANSDYMIGTFDGERFASESGTLKGHRGKGFYAAQTYSDIPRKDGRRIQIGWLQAPSPGMPFNQCMSLPLELRLASTSTGPRLTWNPARELESLRTKTFRAAPVTLRPGDPNPIASANGELLEVSAEFEPGPDTQVKFVVRGVPIAFDARKQEVTVNGHRASAPLVGGKQRLRVFTDRTAFELFASDGQTYVPIPVIAKPDALGVEVNVSGGAATFSRLEAARLRSIWD